ncbi:trypsin-like serine peptidase [Amaricoccus tamworthensis]|uniref:trypsin-like serine peptidase n=1 Tax=Amaricoccus tamworthensis TaxID=57002 RepID=UPI003C7A9DD6
MVWSRLTLAAIGLLLALFEPVVGHADSEPRRMSAAEARNWQAVGRLNVSGTRFCTATLIAPDIVLTAAHCVFHPKTGKKVPVSEFRFVAGWRKGDYAARRRVADAQSLPGFVPGVPALDGVEHDLAVLRLRSPIPDNRAKPLGVTLPSRRGSSMTLVSYDHHRANAPSIRDTCLLMRVERAKAVTDCTIIEGASGAPVLVQRDGNWLVAGVASAMGRIFTGREVTLLATAGSRVPDLIAEMDRSNWPRK